MISDKLKEAREYEEREEQNVPQEVRPTYHFSPRVGWLNDPNGFSFYGGKFHLFYQYHPYDSMWGPMHWGHWVSSDLLHWEWKGVAMAPDQDYDHAGVFSGTALVEGDTLVLDIKDGEFFKVSIAGKEYYLPFKVLGGKKVAFLDISGQVALNESFAEQLVEMIDRKGIEFDTVLNPVSKSNALAHAFAVKCAQDLIG